MSLAGHHLNHRGKPLRSPQTLAEALPSSHPAKHAANAAAIQSVAETEGSVDPKLPLPVLNWLSQLTLFYGLPFVYMVPDQRLLPNESMRFFHVDQNWSDRMVDGALSAATVSTAEAIFNEQLFAAVYAEIRKAQQALRPQLRGKAEPTEVVEGSQYSGFLFRSVVVSTWPGLEVNATKDGDTVGILRMERLSPTVLLVIFIDTPDTVTLTEPSEGLFFGLITAGDGYEVNLRGLGAGGLDAGVPIVKDDVTQTAPIPMRTGDGQPAGVVDVTNAVASISTALKDINKDALPDGVLSPSAFALQLVRGAGRQTLDTSAAFVCAGGSVTQGGGQ